MNEVNPADLNDIQDFFNGASPTEKPHSNPIDVKDFIEWCNNPYEIISKSPDSSDDAKTLSKAVDALNQLDNSELDAMESALRKGTWDDWCETEWSKIRQTKRLKPRIQTMKNHPENAAFYLALKNLTDNQKQYHFCFDKNLVAKIDAFDPFTEGENSRQVLDQQWHVLISVLAFYDAAHALSSKQHKCNYLYQYIKDWDKGALSTLHLQFHYSVNQPPNKRIKLQLVKPKTTTTKAETKTFHSEKMNEWLIEALRKLADK